MHPVYFTSRSGGPPVYVDARINIYLNPIPMRQENTDQKKKKETKKKKRKTKQAHHSGGDDNGCSHRPTIKTPRSLASPYHPQPKPIIPSIFPVKRVWLGCKCVCVWCGRAHVTYQLVQYSTVHVRYSQNAPYIPSISPST